MSRVAERTDPLMALGAALGQARRRWRMRHVAAGAAVVAGTLGVSMWIATAVMESMRFTPESIVAARWALGAVTTVVALWGLVLPLVRRVSDDRLALYLEERVPSLDGAVLSAVEVQRQPADSMARSPLLERGLVADAVRRLERAPEVARIERPATQRGAAIAVLCLTAMGALLAFGPTYVKQGARLLFMPWSDPVTAAVYAIALEPGDATVARGSDVQVDARLSGFTSELVEVVIRRGTGEWSRIPMGVGRDSASWTVRLFDVAEDAEYFVAASGVQSPVARLTVRDLPAVDSLSLELVFPAFTGLPAERIPGGGDIAAIAGTRATVRVHASRTVKGGAIVFDNGSRIPLTVGEGNTLATSMVIRRDGFYRIELQAEDGTVVPGAVEYVIDVLEDAPPSVSITKPGRDMRPTTVDEVFIEAEATDDFGVRQLELVVRVNGGAEQVVPLVTDGPRRREVSAGHTLFLEELPLEPGDVIAYFARARDNGPNGGQQHASDIYFLTVRPFDRTFRQGQGGGGGGGGQGEMNPGALVEQQRDVIAATYKAQRDSQRTQAKTLREDVATIQLAQARAREQVQQLIQRLQRPGVQAADSGFRRIAEIMPRAETEMKSAEEALAANKVTEALGPEQRALQQLERAEAVFRDVQVSMQQGGQGGGGGGNQSAENLADMLELETDKLRNQYESVERSQQQAAQQKIDETLERLKRLAARQQQENERLRQRGQQMQQGGGGGGGGSQRQLADETEQLARQLERLAREQRAPEMEETARRLQDAANQMRRSAAAGGSSAASGASAAEQLAQARRLLEENQRNSGAQGAQEAQRRAEQLAAQQREVAGEVGEMSAGSRGEREQRIDERKAAMAGEVEALERDIERMARENRSRSPGAAQAMRDAVSGMRSTRLADRIQYSRETMRAPSREFANNVERQIQTDLDSLASRARRMAGAAVAGNDSTLRASRALAQASDLVRGMSSLDERLRDRAQRQAGREGPTAQQGQRAGQEQGAQGQGRQGQGGQQGQSGQQGQAGQQGQSGQGQRGQQGQSGEQGQGQGQGEQGGQGGRAQGGRGGSPQEAGVGTPGQRQPGAEVNASGQGRPGAFSAEDVRQFSREFRAQREAAEGLRRSLAGSGIPTADLDRLIARLRELESGRSFDDPAELERLRGFVIEGAKEFEFGLRRQLGAVDREGPVLGGNEDVPGAYRELVNEYFRSLSRRPRR